MEIHNYEKRLRGAYANLQYAPISERNKELIRQCVDDLVLENLKPPRLMKYLHELRKLATLFGKDLDQATPEDVKRVVALIQQKSDYSPWTKQSYKVILRRFYKWLYKTEDYPEIVKCVKLHFGRSERRLPSEGDLLTEQEVERLLDAAHHPWERALVAVLWDSGARISEIGNLSVKHVAFDQYGAILTVHGKTGSRKVRLVWSTPHLSTWLQNHPRKLELDAPLLALFDYGFQPHSDRRFQSIPALRNALEELESSERVNVNMDSKELAAQIRNAFASQANFGERNEIYIALLRMLNLVEKAQSEIIDILTDFSATIGARNIASHVGEGNESINFMHRMYPERRLQIHFTVKITGSEVVCEVQSLEKKEQFLRSPLSGFVPGDDVKERIKVLMLQCLKTLTI